MSLSSMKHEENIQKQVGGLEYLGVGISSAHWLLSNEDEESKAQRFTQYIICYTTSRDVRIIVILYHNTQISSM